MIKKGVTIELRYCSQGEKKSVQIILNNHEYHTVCYQPFKDALAMIMKKVPLLDYSISSKILLSIRNKHFRVREGGKSHDSTDEVQKRRPRIQE